MPTSTRTKRRSITPDDITRLRSVDGPRFEPGGDRIVFVHKEVGAKNEYVTNLWMADADGSSDPVAFTSGGRDSAPRWSPDGDAIAFVRRPEGGTGQLYVIGTDGGEARALTSFPEGDVSDFKWSPDGESIVVRFRERAPEWTKSAKDERTKNGGSDPPWVIDDWWYRLDGDGYFGEQRFHLYHVDVGTGEHRLLYRHDTLGFCSFDFSPDSKQLAIATNRHRKALVRPEQTEIVILTIASGKMRPVPDLPPGPKEGVTWSPNGSRLAYAGRVGEDSTYSTENLELYVCDPKRGNAKSLTGRDDYCLMAVALTDTAEATFAPKLQWSPDSRRIYFRLGHHGEQHLASVAAKGGAITVHTKGAIDADFHDVAADGKRFAMTIGTATKPPEVHVGTMRGSAVTTTAITNLNGAFLKEVKCASIRSHWVRTADGTKVQTWVMLPPDAKRGSRKKYPGVLEIHGGPHAQYGVGFFHEFQVLAAAGYAVVFSNPRGSKGYGRDHCASIRGAWGTTDWVDIQAVTEFMKDHPNIDTKRMGVMGGSYGGYMTNWVIAHSRDFAGAITDRCVANLVSMGGNSDWIEAPDKYFPGNFWDRPEGRWASSPIQHMGRARTPTLIIHSEGDLRCNVEQAEQVFVLLKLNNVPTRLVRYPKSTSHGMSRNGPPDMRLHRLEQILAWWEKYLR